MKTALHAMLLIAALIPLQAQESATNSVGLSFGACNYHLYDEHAAFLIFRGTGIVPAVSYERTKLKNTHSFEGAFSYDKLNTSADNYMTKMLAGNARYSYSRRLFDGILFQNECSMAAGISLSSYILKSDYKFYMQYFWAGAIESWYLSYSADISARFRYSAGEKHLLEARFNLPVVGNVSRPAYSPSGDYNYEELDWDVNPFGETMSFPGHFALNIHVEYLYSLGKNFALKTAYEFYFARCKEPDLLRFYSNNLSMGVMYNF